MSIWFNFDNIPQEQQFSYLLGKQKEKSLEQQILALDYTEENFSKLKELFELWHKQKGIK